MFSKEESKLLREEFWIAYGKSFPRKWLLYNTKIKGLSFKFHFDTKKALVALDLEDDLEHRIKHWPLETKVSIHNKNSWQDVMLFFNEKMNLFEAFFEAYKEVIKM